MGHLYQNNYNLKQCIVATIEVKIPGASRGLKRKACQPPKKFI